MAKWCLIDEEMPLPAAENMARDEYLFDLCHRQKIGFLRLYSWQKPTFSFGVSQKIARAINVDFVESSNCAYVRRITGGKTVLHDEEITYAVVSSEDIFYKDHDLYQSYLLISKVLLDAFQSLGIDANLAAGSPAHLSRSSNPCFSFPTANELEIAKKKIVGSAQKRDKHALLQHGSIPMTMDYELYARGTGADPDFIKQKMTTFSEVSTKSRAQLTGALIDAFSAFIGNHSRLEEFRFDDKQKEEIARIEEKYRSKDWNFRL